MYEQYKALADTTPGVTFVGRLATYRYYNMDQVVAQALKTYRTLRERMLPQTQPALLETALGGTMPMTNGKVKGKR